MDRDDLLKYVGKYVKVCVNKGSIIFNSFFILHKKENLYNVAAYNPYFSMTEEDYVQLLDNQGRDIKEIDIILEDENIFLLIPIFEHFGHEIGDWLSKPIQLVSIDFSKYPHTCKKCGSPSWNNPVTNHTDCSNKNCGE